MPSPSYASATTSSTLKSTSQPSPSKSISNPNYCPQRLKRPSTLTPHHRLAITYRSDLYPIKPHDPSKPCPLATLPSELRTSIYQHAIDVYSTISHPRSIFIPQTRRRCYSWPHILHVSKAIRIEAAYVYYTSTPFTFTVQNLDFENVRMWLEVISLRHRGLLARNQKVRIEVLPSLRHTYTYPPPDWLLDAPLQLHWKFCRQSGNIYTIPSKHHKTHFILFTRMQAWFRLNDTPPYRDIRWHYVFDTTFPTSWWEQCNAAVHLCEFLKEQVGVLGLGCVARAWTRGRVQGKGRQEARAFLRDLDSCFRMLGEGCGNGVVEEWEEVMGRLRVVIEVW